MPGPADTDDRALVDALQSGTRARRDAAFVALLNAYRDRVYRLALTLLADEGLAEDVCQEVFLAVLRGVERFRGQARLSTWIYRITLRAALRSRSRVRRRPEVSAGDPPPAISVSAVAPARVELAAVARAMARLPVAQQTVLVLVTIEELSHQQVAEILGVPVGTVWSRLHAARRTLLAALEAPPRPR